MLKVTKGTEKVQHKGTIVNKLNYLFCYTKFILNQCGIVIDIM